MVSARVNLATPQSVIRLFAAVTEALARSTWALLGDDTDLGRTVVDGDSDIDDQVAALERELWAQVDETPGGSEDMRRLVALLLVVPELERSADLAEHIAQRAVNHLGRQMSPVSRGIVERMSEVAIEMWKATADAFAEGTTHELELDETDEELDILHNRLTAEIATGSMDLPVAAQVTLLARFYERLGDHAVNLSRRMPPA